MRTLLMLGVLLCAVPAFAQTDMRVGQTARVSWSGDCVNVCDQPTGESGYRVVLDGVVVATVAPTDGTYDLGDVLTVGDHTVAIEAFNCLSCPPPEQKVRGFETTIRVLPARPGPPNRPSVPTVEVLP